MDKWDRKMLYFAIGLIIGLTAGGKIVELIGLAGQVVYQATKQWLESML